MKNPDLELPGTFVAVADARSFASSGVRTGRSQAAVSQQMHRLETLVGVPLFRKNGRNKLLTPGALQLLSPARELLRISDDAVQSVVNGAKAGVLRIGSPQNVSNTFLPPVLARIAR
ncbi:LysR family transcriptional regulator [Paraburkholderia silvatlantica]|uniref:DNA-binding transcriptional LysR family regulator n=1 Tax=Paraburkholderia silvatlantica TaxID=321895 RepID=A0ABR6FVX2_9BURK|nr:LysR family transcriptional regulator [Paraburkholderia silvatlantica]MBB2931523.1 DNA-binding transcriptional LysR family regulator [Paraburkholderia silvatlantica]PVY27813.1 regulatory helix-turn-helix LysR family protein [Paraburkholderia silvatlantica]PXW34660.1 regulatory helix-turn-helix LysR family protein [Paraburkholderia silvatlantica]